MPITRQNFIKIIFGLIIIAFIYSRCAIVHIAYVVDRNYLPYMMTSLHSAILHKNMLSHYKVHVIAEDFTKADEELLQKMESSGIDIKIYPAQKLELDMSHLGRFASFKISLQKIYLADYLKDVNKVLYLDADTLVQKDLARVYKKDMAGYYIAAVKDGLMYQHPEHIEEIGLKEHNFYFNSGVMLLNLKKMRKDDVVRSAEIYFNTHQEVFGDQDVLNVVLKKGVLALPYRYNVNSTFFEEKPASFLSTFYGKKVPNSPKAVYKKAVILHFAGHKPWTEYFTHPYLKPLWKTYNDKMKKKYFR